MTEDITTLVNDDVIAQVLSECKESLPIYHESIDRGLDFANALLYHLESALELYFSEFAKCQCLTTLRVADLRRGYCQNCFGAIVVQVSGKAIGK